MGILLCILDLDQAVKMSLAWRIMVIFNSLGSVSNNDYSM